LSITIVFSTYMRTSLRIVDRKFNCSDLIRRGNILAEGNEVSGLIDFGDMVHTHTICDLAIAMGYTSLESDDVLQVILEMAIGYNESMPLGDDELTVLFPMMCMRLAVSACMGLHQIRQRPDDPYLAISQEPIRRTLPKLLALDANEVH
jgi:Ser/Thr protein kinase RdoA (MazF antagonist)